VYAEPPEQCPTSIAKLDDEEVGNVKSFKYLGGITQFDQPTTGDTEITTRIDMAESKFYEHGEKLMNHKIKLSTRILSRLTYGCQTWTLNNRQKERVNSAYTSMQRKMVRGGYHRKENEWGYKLTNQDILSLCKTESIDAFTSRQISLRPGRQTAFIKSALDGANIHQFAQEAFMKKI